MTSRVRVQIAGSLDGFIAGPNDDSRLTGPDAADRGGGSDPAALTYEAFIADVGALLIGRGRDGADPTSAAGEVSCSDHLTGRFFHSPSSSCHV